MPLLRGGVVVATHDSDGDLDGLSWGQLDLLVQRSRSLTERDERALSRRITRDARRQQRDLEAARQINPVVRWMHYYGAFYRSELYPLLSRINAYLMRWIRSNYKRLRTIKKAAGRLRG